MINLMNEYIKVINSNMNKTMRICIENRYIKKIADDFIDSYIDIRYFGLIEAKKGLTVKNKILTELRKLKDEQIEDPDNKEKIKTIELTYIFIDSCIALNEKQEEDIQEEIELIVRLRKEHLGIDDSLEFRVQLNELIKNSKQEKEEVLKKVEADKFYLKFSNLKNSNLKNVIIKYNIKFPAIYSNDSITKAFNTGTTQEDKLFIEYFLVTAQIIRDIEQSNYRRQYILEFADTLLEKNQKLARVLEIINNPSIQDRAILKVNHKSLQKSKETIYELLRNGYKIALNLDNDFEVNEFNLQRLSMFEYVLADKTQDIYKQLYNYKLNNLVEI